MTDSKNRTEDGLGVIRKDETKQPDYLATCIFVYLLLNDSGLTTKRLSEALEHAQSQLIDSTPSASSVVCVGNPTRAQLAQTLVNDFLCKEG